MRNDPLERVLAASLAAKTVPREVRKGLSDAVVDAMQEGVSAVELAQALGVSKQRVYAIVAEFAGEREQPKPKGIHHRSMPDREPVRELETSELIGVLDEVAGALTRIAPVVEPAGDLIASVTEVEAAGGLTESPNDGLDACDVSDAEERLALLEDRWERLVDAVVDRIDQPRPVSEALLLDCLADQFFKPWAAELLAELEEAFALRQELAQLPEAGA